MKYNNQGYNRRLVGDLYHWEADQSGYFIIKENNSKTKPHKMIKREFKAIKTVDIMEDLKD